VSGLANIWTLERSPLPGHDYFDPVSWPGTRHHHRDRARDWSVEQVFCTDQNGNAIAFANLKDPSPAFVVSHQEVETQNSLVGAMIRKIPLILGGRSDASGRVGSPALPVTVAGRDQGSGIATDHRIPNP